jgi:hypothetical protein
VTDAKTLIADAQAEATRRREAHEDALELAAVPGSTVYVLHDGRRGWMHGESGTVVWANAEEAEVLFKDRGALKFKLQRLSRRPDGPDCMQARWALNVAAAHTRPER